jgi:monoamine oxidase
VKYEQEEGMSSTQQDQQRAGAEERATDFDAIIVGAGFSGLYMLHSLRN